MQAPPKAVKVSSPASANDWLATPEKAQKCNKSPVTNLWMFIIW